MNQPSRIALALSCIAALSASTAQALPRYSATYGQDCGLCHRDPTGGGLRTLYASQYLVPTELAHTAPDLETINPLIADRFLVGVDLRTLFANGEDTDAIRLQMQSELHIAFLADERMSIQLDLGQGGAQEAFGLAYVLPAHGWLKAGRFTPNYGWKFADHQMFARRYVPDRTGARSPRDWESTGLELGLAPGPVQLTASLDEGGEAGESWTTSGVWRLSPGSWNLVLGASYMRREHRDDGHRRSAGLHGAANIGPLSWVWEWDEPQEDDLKERIVSQELSFVVVRGVFLRAIYGFYDPDIDVDSGRRERIGLGVDYFATPFFDTLLMFNYDDDGRAPAEVYGNGWSADFVVHFLY